MSDSLRRCARGAITLFCALAAALPPPTAHAAGDTVFFWLGAVDARDSIPGGPLLVASDGFLYGTTVPLGDQAPNRGTIFRMSAAGETGSSRRGTATSTERPFLPIPGSAPCSG